MTLLLSCLVYNVYAGKTIVYGESSISFDDICKGCSRAERDRYIEEQMDRSFYFDIAVQNAETSETYRNECYWTTAVKKYEPEARNNRLYFIVDVTCSTSY